MLPFFRTVLRSPQLLSETCLLGWHEGVLVCVLVSVGGERMLYLAVCWLDVQLLSMQTYGVWSFLFNFYRGPRKG